MTKIINGKEYEKYDAGLGLNSGTVLLILIKKSLLEHKLYYAEFNGSVILSDEDSLDGVYKKVLNKTWLEYIDYIKCKVEK